MRFFFFILLLLSVFPALSQDTLTTLKAIPMNARLMTVDELGNVYVVKQDNMLVRYSENGDSSGFYRSVQNGDIGSIDATNPLRIVVYYPAYSKVVLLDRMLALKNELDLRKLNIFTTPAVASSADGNLWIYDQFNARLKKINEQLVEVGQSNDLRQEIRSVPSPSFMVERSWKVFLCDTMKGIYTFDRYGNYINTLSIFGVKNLQVFGAQLIYRHEDSLYSWNLEKVTSNVMLLPGVKENIIHAAIVRSRLYVLYKDALIIYRFKE